MNLKKAIEWIGTHDVGASSRCMWCAVMGINPPMICEPFDYDDFGRCYDLYKYAELCHLTLKEVGKLSPTWERIYVFWDSLCELYDNEYYEELNITLKEYRK